jgi:peptide/nickel transport system ATP-binding protein
VAVTVLRVEDLVVTISGHRVVDGVTFAVDAGERVALIGASGSGKSLTAAAIVGHLPPVARATGQVRVDGQDVVHVPAARRPRTAGVAAVAQDPLAALNPLVSIGTQLAIPLRHRQGLRGTGLTERATDLLRSVGIEDPVRVLHSWAGELSGGQRQRVCIAIALACRTSLLVADEPTTALDVVTQAQVVGVLRAHGRGSALLFITHDVAVAASLCDRAIVLAEGRVVEEGSLTGLIAAPQHRYTRQLVHAARASTAWDVA